MEDGDALRPEGFGDAQELGLTDMPSGTPCFNKANCGKHDKSRSACEDALKFCGKGGKCRWMGLVGKCCCLGSSEKMEEAEKALRDALPMWVLIAIGAVALLALIACFATGVCEAVAIIAAVGVAAAAAIFLVLEVAGVEVA